MIIIPRTITRGFVKANPQWNFVHGFDVQHKGCFGHASIYNENNTFPIPTMYKFCASGARYFTDADSDARLILLTAIHSLPQDKPIIVLRRIGCGCSRMRELAPILYRDMVDAFEKIESKDFKWSQFEHMLA